MWSRCGAAADGRCDQLGCACVCVCVCERWRKWGLRWEGCVWMSGCMFVLMSDCARLLACKRIRGGSQERTSAVGWPPEPRPCRAPRARPLEWVGARSAGSLCYGGLFAQMNSFSRGNEIFKSIMKVLFSRRYNLSWVKLRKRLGTRVHNCFHSLWCVSLFLCRRVRLITSCPARFLRAIKIQSLCRRAFPVWQETGFWDKALFLFLHKDGRKRSTMCNYWQREGEPGQSLFLLEGKVLIGSDIFLPILWFSWCIWCSLITDVSPRTVPMLLAYIGNHYAVQMFWFIEMLSCVRPVFLRCDADRN